MERVLSGQNIHDYLQEYIAEFGDETHVDIIRRQLNEESTYPKLYHNIVQTQNFDTKKRQYAIDPIDVVELKFVPWSKSTTLAVKAVAQSGNKNYDVNITFPKVKYYKVDGPDAVSMVGADGNKFFINPIKLNSTTVKVKCNCLDFYWRFAYYNNVDKSLIGKPPKPYIKTTDRPPVNPNQVPGICKHLIKTFDALRKTGVIR